jgi:hypothetical protein
MNSIRPAIGQVLFAIVLFLILSVAYMYPVLEGKNLHQGDIVQYKGSAKEISDYREKTGQEALWTGSMFAGMPAYLISTKFKSNILRFFHYLLILNGWRPVCFIFLYLIGFYIALRVFGINGWLSIVGSIAYAFSSYLIVILVAGHNSKAMALGYMPAIIAGVYLAFRGKYLLGGVLMGLFLSLQIYVIHFQITYYTFLIVLILGLVEFITAIREKQLKQFSLALGVLAIAAMLAVASNLSSLWTTTEYGKYSIRGKSDLSINAENKTSGLDKDYATGWSYGTWETFTLLIPNFNGGATITALPVKSNTYAFFKRIQGADQARKAIKQMPTYWGGQPSTAGPVYAGAIIIFLFILGLYIVRGKMKWWLVSITIFSICLAWGRHFSLLTNLFLDYFPAYNKFRTVSMILVMAEFSLPLMAILTVNEIVKGAVSKEKIIKYSLRAFYITGGICLFFILFASSLFDFKAETDQQYLAQGYTDFVKALQADRLMLLRQDAFRSMVFISLALGLIYLFIKQKLNSPYFIVGLGLLILIDMWPVDKRYVNNSDFVSKHDYDNPIPKSKADDFILTDGARELDYRVLNIAVNTFNDATTSYYHKSLGGYHGAKMRRYQELVDIQMIPEIQRLYSSLRKGNLVEVDSTLTTLDVLNMLNTHYIIINPDGMPLVNSSAFGNAWFVNGYQVAKNADEEIDLLGKTNLRNELVVSNEYESLLSEMKTIPDSTASIKLISYEPNKLVYKTSSLLPQVAVFSEIYYPRGWNVTIDDENTSYFRADFLLRAMTIPSGKHEIVFSFKPNSFYTGNKIALAGSGILLLLLLGTVFLELRKYLASKDLAK